MFSPELWRKYFKSGFKKIFDAGKKHSKKIWFHSCGNILDVLPDLIDIGIDVWETVQLHTLPIDAKTLKREFGKEITFSGVGWLRCVADGRFYRLWFLCCSD